MDLITDKIKESSIFQTLSQLLHHTYIDKGNLRDIISFDEFKKLLEIFIEEIMKDYPKKDIVFLCILKGSVVFTVELAKRIKNNVQFEFTTTDNIGKRIIELLGG